MDAVRIVLMVLGIVGLVLSLVLANTARRTEVVHHSDRGEVVETRREDPLL